MQVVSAVKANLALNRSAVTMRFYFFLAGIVGVLGIKKKIFYFQAATFLYHVLYHAGKRHKKRATEKTVTL